MDLNVWTKIIKDRESIIEEGSTPYYAYIIMSGKAKVFKIIDGKQVLIYTASEGDILGEMAFFENAERTASVIADGNVEVELIARDTFMKVLDQVPKDVQSRLNPLFSDLKAMTEVNSRLVALLDELQHRRPEMNDPKSFEREIEKMPELLRRVVIGMVQRLNASMEWCTKLAGKVEETGKQSTLYRCP